MKIYLAGPFFNEEQISYIEKAETILRRRGFDVFSPREHTADETLPNHLWAQKIFEIDVQALSESDLAVAVYHGMYSDTGTAWEIGYAYANKIPIVLVCTDCRASQSAMVVNASKAVIGVDALSDYDFDTLPAGNVIDTQI
ncbi:MAG TPA: nucleoside 2-deoxyribosyltransferase [Ruminococcaceae bacterium]|nr:nucleoside 2-deoxyribosyltransferase [Oscillospiraceae bacterium]